jgi:predicted transcriptional regulator of viral defense system
VSPLRPKPSDECGFTVAERQSDAKVLVADLAASQFGRVRVDQVRRLGVDHSKIRRWSATGYFHRELPRVYAVGHPGRSAESDLAAAVLYAGPGAMLSHATAAWWLGLLNYPPKTIWISSPRAVRSPRGIRIRGRRHLDRILHRGLPVTNPSQTIIDYAAIGPTDLLRFALANADYHDLLNVEALSSLTGRGVAGSAALKAALAIHLPELAHTRSRGERVMVMFCQSHGLPIPEVNVYVHGWLVDAHWPAQKVVVEIDGWRGHRSPAQLHTDHQRALELRALGYVVLRYTEQQLIDSPAAVAADIRRYL